MESNLELSKIFGNKNFVIKLYENENSKIQTSIKFRFKYLTIRNLLNCK